MLMSPIQPPKTKTVLPSLERAAACPDRSIDIRLLGVLTEANDQLSPGNENSAI